MRPLEQKDVAYVHSWELRDKKDVHPSHRTAVVEVSQVQKTMTYCIKTFFATYKKPIVTGVSVAIIVWLILLVGTYYPLYEGVIG